MLTRNGQPQDRTRPDVSLGSWSIILKMLTPRVPPPFLRYPTSGGPKNSTGWAVPRKCFYILPFTVGLYSRSIWPNKNVFQFVVPAHCKSSHIISLRRSLCLMHRMYVSFSAQPSFIAVHWLQCVGSSAAQKIPFPFYQAHIFAG